MRVELTPAGPEHLGELGRVYYEAFEHLADGHNFDFGYSESVASARRMYRALLDTPAVYVAAALVDGQLVGSAWVFLGDEVASIEDVNVEPSTQSKGIGRALMEHMLDHARRNGFEMVRLTQSAYNVASLSLYASLGFDAKDAFVEMNAVPSAVPNEAVRPLVRADLPAVGALSGHIYKVSRRKEAKTAIDFGSTALAYQRDGHVTGYFLAEFGGPCIAESEDDAFAMIGEAARLMPDRATFNCPLSLPGLYRTALARGCKALQVHTVMAIGPYRSPEGVWMPGGGY